MNSSSAIIDATPLPDATPSAPSPTLTTVNVFYNDLPAIVLDGVPMIRLADIHHQVLAISVLFAEPYS